METIANKKVSMAYLQEYELRAKKKFGQNFIIDPSVVRKIASLSHGGDTVVEIGPGLGALTQQLALMYKQVIAYEIDPHMVEVLSSSLSELDNVEVVLQDFMKADLSRFKGQKVSVCANLPYYITTPLLFKLMELDVYGMTLMVQKEIGERLAAKPNTREYSALTIQIQYYFDVKTVMNVSKESFHPRPNVDSIVVSLTPKAVEMPYDEKAFFAFVKACFQFRRKTLTNNLKTLNLDVDYHAVLTSCGIDEKVRADMLSYDDYIKLYGVLYA
ncbi:dimethyladenosine transferase [Erysipelothrix larvae]|uniref:Ribosomal RNA small subunit methyltransferase A n=1 Tax=Erysipelothrix larvae TaxID=1514105 RepID=A0A0X8GXY1_9FIRM|nr:dimethyladenosine transferase [Erysipelothrix larvae]